MHSDPQLRLWYQRDSTSTKGVGRGLMSLGAAAVIALLCCGCLADPALAQGSRDHVAPSTWWPKVDKARQAIDSGRWKPASRQLARLEEEVLGRSWHGPELRQVLTEVAFLQALALANLDEDRRAIWWWHMATNFDFKVAQRDLTPYGKAARLLLEYPLRKKGTIPPGFDPHPPSHQVEVVPADWPRLNATPTILNNTGAALEHRGDLFVEVIVDEKGLLHQPVVESSHLHPVVIYGSLKYLYEMPAFKPATFDGRPADLMMSLRLYFEVGRW